MGWPLIAGWWWWRRGAATMVWTRLLAQQVLGAHEAVDGEQRPVVWLSFKEWPPVHLVLVIADWIVLIKRCLC